MNSEVRNYKKLNLKSEELDTESRIHKTKKQNAFLRLIKRTVFSIVFSLGFFSATYASDPVTVIVSLSPPYTPFLNEYGSSGVDKLQVSLLVNDSRIVNYPAKLQMLIEHVGSGIVMRTSEFAAIAPIILTSHVTEVFNGFELHKYFLAQNNVFTGFDQSQYIQTGRIPDGQYRIGFRVVDAQRTDVVLSNTAYTQPGWFVLNDPPQINLPRNKEKVRVNDLQHVKLEWFPRHFGSLNAAFATSYQIELFAIRIPGMDPNQVAVSMQPDFIDVTNSTSYNLTHDKYLLEPGIAYAYRIKAMAGDAQMTLFQNDGYSEVFSFVYGSLCPETKNLSAQTLGTDKVEITWDTDPLQTSFETRFRKSGQVNDVWHTRESFIGMAEISNVLSPGVKYEYQVKARCTSVESAYSSLDYFTMPYPPSTKFACGTDDEVIEITNTTPKASLQVGDIIYSGQFPIKLTEVSGANGLFKGKGRMRVPMFANAQVNMQFNDIKVNELNQVYGGELVSVFNEHSKFLVEDGTDYEAEDDIAEGDVAEDQVISPDVVVDDDINSVYVNDAGEVIVVNTDGEEEVVDTDDLPEGEEVVIEDERGEQWVVDEGGRVDSEVTDDGEKIDNNTGSSQPNRPISISSVVFSENLGQNAGFDANTFTEYPSYLNEFGVPVVWKSLKGSVSDKIDVNIVSSSMDTIYFEKDTNLTMLTPLQTNKPTENLNLASSLNNSDMTVYARKDSINGDSIAVFKVRSYSTKIRSLGLIYINEQDDDVQGLALGNGHPNSIAVKAGTDGVLSTIPSGDDVVTSGGLEINTGANGICETSASTMDVQLIAVGNGEPNRKCVNRGANMFLDTPMPMGDDIIVSDSIHTGPNGICETSAFNNVSIVATVPGTLTGLKNFLNKVYKPANLEFSTVTNLGSIDVNYDLDKDKLLDVGNWFSPSSNVEYNEIKTAIEQFLTSNGDVHSYYVTVIDNPNHSRLLGKGGLGETDPEIFRHVLLCSSNHGGAVTTFYNTVAHELGHAIFDLEHPFHESIIVSKGYVGGKDPDNFMDYQDGDKSRKYQWDQIHREIKY